MKAKKAFIVALCLSAVVFLFYSCEEKPEMAAPENPAAEEMAASEDPAAEEMQASEEMAAPDNPAAEEMPEAEEM